MLICRIYSKIIEINKDSILNKIFDTLKSIYTECLYGMLSENFKNQNDEKSLCTYIFDNLFNEL